MCIRKEFKKITRWNKSALFLESHAKKTIHEIPVGKRLEVPLRGDERITVRR